jgi:hypothetical protein
MQKTALTINSPKLARKRGCVYRIWFGDAFYIGSSMDLETRLKMHVYKIYKCFLGKGIGNNSQTQIMNYLANNPGITDGLVEILSFADSEQELVQAESLWMERLFDRSACLNYSNKTSRVINGTIIRPNHAKKGKT